MNSRSFTAIAATLSVCLLAACAGPVTKQISLDPERQKTEAAFQSEMVVNARRDDLLRLDRLAFPLWRENVDLCGEKVANNVGFSLYNARSLVEKKLRPAAHRVLGLDSKDRVSILSIDPEGPASTLDIRPGDILTAIESEPAPKGKKGVPKARKALTKAASMGSVTLSLLRGGETITRTIEPVAYCAGWVNKENGNTVNAYADGKDVYIHAGMMRFATDDKELAVVLGHELAHNAMRHVEKQKANALPGMIAGGVLDVLLGTGGGISDAMGAASRMAFSASFEQEADYVGLYMLARAGYDTSVAPGFWRKMATVSSGSISISTTHPTTPDRFLALDQTVGEIATKQERLIALVPDPLEPSGDSNESATAVAESSPKSGPNSGSGDAAEKTETAEAEAAVESGDPTETFVPPAPAAGGNTSALK